MKNFIYLLTASGILLSLIGCVENPLKDEQYVKKVFIVGAADEVQTKEIYYTSDEEQETYISVGVGGSLLIDSDVQFALAEADEFIDEYNERYISGENPRYHKINEGLYSVPSMSGTIKAGETYARVPIKIKAHELECDSLYMLSFKLASASCEISKPDTILLFTFNMVNRYSGNYQLQAITQELQDGQPVGDPSMVASVRTLKAIDEYEVRFFNLATIEENRNIASSCIRMKINPEDNTLSMSGWDKLEVLSSEGVYDPETKGFTFKYVYRDTDGKTYSVDGTLKQLEEN